MQVYTGKIGNTPEKGQGMRVVKDLIQPFTNTWHEITADNLFTTVELAEDLWQMKTLYTGTMRANKPTIPPEFLNTKAREADTTIEAFNGRKMLTSYFEKKGKKPVIMLTTKIFEKSNNRKGKPDVIKFYNKTKGGVDIGDKSTRNTTVQRRSRVWTKKLFFEMADIACLNAYKLFTSLQPTWNASKTGRRAEFLKILSEELAIDHMKSRISVGHLPQDLSTNIQSFINDRPNPCSTCTAVACSGCIMCKKMYCEHHIAEKPLIMCTSCNKAQGVPVHFVQKSHRNQRCRKCSKRRVSFTLVKCCCCEEYVCSNCSIETKHLVCFTCQK